MYIGREEEAFKFQVDCMYMYGMVSTDGLLQFLVTSFEKLHYVTAQM